MREQQLEQDQHVAEARESPSPRTAGRYTKPKDRRTASKYRYSMSRDRLTRKCERCGYAEHLRGGSCPALGQRCNKCNAKGHVASVCRSERNTANFERHKAYEVEREGTKPYRGNAESDGRGIFVGDIESDRTKPQVETGQSIAFLSVVDCTEQKDAWFVTLTVKRMRLRFKIDTGADVTMITKKTWLAMKDKPRLEPTAVRLNSVGGQLKAFGQFMAVTKHRNTVYRFNVIIIEGEKMTNLMSRDVAADMGLVCRLEQVDASGDDDARIGLMKTEPVTIKLKALCLTTARRVTVPLMDAVKAELNNMVESGVIRSVTEPTDWCAAMVPVIKKTGAVRICVDLKQLNTAVRREHHMLPSLEDIAPKLAESKVFSTLDAASGFWQIPIDEDSQLLTTFITPFGRYAFCRLPFGISSATEIFQRKMPTLLEGLDGVEVAVDDILVHGRKREEHDARLNAVLRITNDSGLKLNLKKCVF
ncbi:hypothetical protein NP493_866g01020 [Ridgeia piscesae]|uniref:Reverse transcriptase domain-containing protein n=1 Tax=Ridgeia piscesae TaxID=27915 RepID=A0AAD9KLN5_RIDPI|nr:hypothetical protein NP493_866g01020 [Ridgeia piscesae]